MVTPDIRINKLNKFDPKLFPSPAIVYQASHHSQLCSQPQSLEHTQSAEYRQWLHLTHCYSTFTHSLSHFHLEWHTCLTCTLLFVFSQERFRIRSSHGLQFNIRNIPCPSWNSKLFLRGGWRHPRTFLRKYFKMNLHFSFRWLGKTRHSICIH